MAGGGVPISCLGGALDRALYCARGGAPFNLPTDHCKVFAACTSVSAKQLPRGAGGWATRHHARWQEFGRPWAGTVGRILYEQTHRLEEALEESQARLEAEDGACSHTCQRLQSSRNETISLRANMHERDTELVRLRDRCEAAEKQLERFEAASLSVLERVGGSRDFNSSFLPRASPAPAASPRASATAHAPHGREEGGLFQR